MSEQDQFPEQFDDNGTSTCPTCGRSFDQIGVMRAHHSRAHGERLHNRACEGCEQTFYDPKGELQFCDNCNAFAGEHNGNWRDAQEEGECIVCGESFTYYPSEKPGRYCSDCYQDPEVSGNPPQEWWGEGSRTVSYEQCDDEFTVYRWKAENQETFYCDRKYYSNYLSENRDWDYHRRNPYGPYWHRLRVCVLERDEYTCQRWGSTETETDRSLEVHHIIPIRKFEKPDDANSIGNLVSLCGSCHRKVEGSNVIV